jgi:formate-dependent nitrite reductase membrane component NrfD
MPTWTCAFYIFVVVVAAFPLFFVGFIWREAQKRDWAWTNSDSRNMYVDAAKTLITASGIAVALLASSSVASARTASPLIAFSAKVASVCLISCVCFSLVIILALLRGYERAWSRNMEKRRTAEQGPTNEGKLNNAELLFILVPSGVALSSFVVGFVFLGRIAFHF